MKSGQVSNPTSKYRTPFIAMRAAYTSTISELLRGLGASSPIVRMELGQRINFTCPNDEPVNFQ
jgi:hypothetical protein